MLFAWRGRGVLGLVALMLPLASCAGLMDTSPVWAMTLGGVSLFGGGLACYLIGRKWNRGRGIHTMYWAPLENWGWRTLFSGACSDSWDWLALSRSGSPVDRPRLLSLENRR